jgi:hypothetical protein
VAVDDQDSFLGQRLLQNKQHFLVVERTDAFGLARIHRRQVTALHRSGQELNISADQAKAANTPPISNAGGAQPCYVFIIWH